MGEKTYDVIMFDLGGVLIELTGTSRMIEWTDGNKPVEELLNLWLKSNAVRNFESGRATPVEFASGIISEFSLPVKTDRFLEEFPYWINDTYSGVKKLLQEVSGTYNIASLSNTNELHWDRISNEMNLPSLFDFNFPSHITGLLKPDKEAFSFAAESIGCLPEKILFFDDTLINVESARSIGMSAYRVSGFEELSEMISQLKLL
ncbi:MAG: HAD-IA family hydrolase [Desulfobacterales bacterium]|nr:HAD-IA family hydrolase [Desulfobacteraceae bacterium]MBT7697042.1 HAD-IA family hydrolase [Desulfobacterales bacterium]